ncbi:MAG TPA: carbohydrate ABC transporter permease [Firmicutes bacterium]|nr:carbohydrate ABC transporter permease [Bacillota bacterium]
MRIRGQGVSWKEVAIHGGILTFLLITVFPIFWMLISSIKPPGIVFATPPVWIFKPTLENYIQALGYGPRGWGTGMSHFFWNSLVIATVVTVSNLIIGALAGYGMARYKVGGETLPLAFLLGKMLPPTVLILPFFLIIKKLGLGDSQLGLVLAYTALNLPFCVWMARGFFLDLPREIEEAAMIDGCSRLQSLIRVVAPLALPGLIAIGILVYVFCWNEFMFAMILTSLKARTLPVAASLFITDEAILWGPMTATGVIIMSVPILLTLVAQRYIIAGLSAGALKG